jgi:hypothetical protein
MINISDVGAEKGLLGAALATPGARPHFLTVPPEAYTDPRHTLLAAIMRDMIAKGEALDPITLQSALQDLGALGRFGNGAYLHSLIAHPWQALYSGDYAARVVELHGRRKLYLQCKRTLQRLDADDDTESAPLEAAVGEMRTTLDEVAALASKALLQEPMSLIDLLAGEDRHDWIIPGLMERADRLVLTGDEGFGKSELVAQFALCAAADIHPFSGDLLDTQARVLVVDCENGVAQSRRRYRRIAGAVDEFRAAYDLQPEDWGKRLKIEFRTGGLDLTSGTDTLWLEGLVSSVSPDILVIGPLYKLHNANINDAESAKRILHVLDGLRERHGCAIITEAHAGKAESNSGLRKMAPEGSSVFLRWPEFGFGLRRVKDDPTDGRTADVVAWRGQREERGWPGQLIKRTFGSIPWGPNAEYYDQH